ncbi:hypothetical protein MTO96_050221 [Rhipicephalus appendiculatus]
MQRKQETVNRQHDGRRSTFRLFRAGDWVYVKTVRQEEVSWTEGRVVRTNSPVTYLVETKNTVRHVHVDHLHSRSSSQYAGSNIATEALRRPSTEDSVGRREAPTMPQQAHPDAETAEHLRNDATVVAPPPTGGQEWPPASGSRQTSSDASGGAF